METVNAAPAIAIAGDRVKAGTALPAQRAIVLPVRIAPRVKAEIADHAGKAAVTGVPVPKGIADRAATVAGIGGPVVKGTVDPAAKAVATADRAGKADAGGAMADLRPGARARMRKKAAAWSWRPATPSAWIAPSALP